MPKVKFQSAYAMLAALIAEGSLSASEIQKRVSEEFKMKIPADRVKLASGEGFIEYGKKGAKIVSSAPKVRKPRIPKEPAATVAPAPKADKKPAERKIVKTPTRKTPVSKPDTSGSDE
jgi:hypothetical protein